MKYHLLIDEYGEAVLIDETETPVWESDDDDDFDMESNEDEICEYLARKGIVESVDDINEITNESEESSSDDDDDDDELTELSKENDDD